jgi:putative CocE/NonD family hydrolase
MGVNKWRDEKEWPLARTKYTPLYLHEEGQLNKAIPEKNVEPEHFVYDPQNPVPSAGGAMLGTRAGIQIQNEIEKRGDVLVYSTVPLSKQVEVTGPVRAVLYISTDAVSTDFTAKLVDVYPDGTAYNLSDGIIRRSYDPSGKEPIKITIELWPTSNVFLKGHKIRLEISSSNFPRYDRNLNTGDDAATAIKMLPAKQTVFHSEKYPSRIILPIIP